MKILLLGASGQLGFDIQKTLFNHELINFTSNDFDFLSEEQFNCSAPVDVVINCMAMTNTGLCEDEKENAFKLNGTRVGEIARYCKDISAPLFHFSTDYVFDGKEKRSYTEEDITNPLSVYGLSKLKGEEEALKYHNKVFIFRVSSLYGIGGNNFVKTILMKADANESLRIVSDQYMSPTHSLDVAKAVKFFIDQEIDDYGIYHTSNKGVCSWFDFTKEILSFKKINNKVEEVSYKDFPTKLERPQYSELNTAKISKYYNMPPWQESLKEFLEILGQSQGVRI